MYNGKICSMDHSHICQTDIFLSHKFKKYNKREQLYEVPAIKKRGTGIKNQLKRRVPDVLAQMAS